MMISLSSHHTDFRIEVELVTKYSRISSIGTRISGEVFDLVRPDQYELFPVLFIIKRIFVRYLVFSLSTLWAVSKNELFRIRQLKQRL